MRDSLYGQHTALIKPALIISTLTLFEKKKGAEEHSKC